MYSNIRDYKSEEELKTRLRDMMDNLRLASRLNEDYENINLEGYKLDHLQIKPMPPPVRSLAEIEKDTVEQKRLFFNNLQQVMNDDDEIRKVLTRETDATILFMNNNFLAFKEWLKGRTNISAEEMTKLITNFNTELKKKGLGQLGEESKERSYEELMGELKSKATSALKDDREATQRYLDAIIPGTMDRDKARAKMEKLLSQWSDVLSEFGSEGDDVDLLMASKKVLKTSGWTDEGGKGMRASKKKTTVEGGAILPVLLSKAQLNALIAGFWAMWAFVSSPAVLALGFVAFCLAIVVWYALDAKQKNTLDKYLEDSEKLRSMALPYFRGTENEKNNEFNTYMLRVLNTKDQKPRSEDTATTVRWMRDNWSKIIQGVAKNSATWKPLTEKTIQLLKLPFEVGEFNKPMDLPEMPLIERIVAKAKPMLDSSKREEEADWVKVRLMEKVDMGFYVKEDLEKVLKDWRTVMKDRSTPTNHQGIMGSIDEYIMKTIRGRGGMIQGAGPNIYPFNASQVASFVAWCCWAWSWVTSSAIIGLGFAVFVAGALAIYLLSDDAEKQINQFMNDRERLKKRIIGKFHPPEKQEDQFNTFMYRLTTIQDPATGKTGPRGDPHKVVHKLLSDWDKIFQPDPRRAEWRQLVEKIIEYYKLPSHRHEFARGDKPIPEEPAIRSIVEKSKPMFKSEDREDESQYVYIRLRQKVDMNQYFKQDLEKVVQDWKTVMKDRKTPTNHQGVLGSIDDYIVANKNKKPEEEKRGHEIEVVVGGRGRRRATIGRGIDTNQHTYQRLGKFIIHRPSLLKHVLNIKYPSKAVCPSIPKQVISKALTEFMLDMLDNEKINQTLLQNLPDQDRKLFYEIAQKTNTNDTLGLGTSHYTNNEDFERFELLRSEMMAGNNAPEVLRELKKHILKFLSNGTLQKPLAYELLSEIALLA